MADDTQPDDLATKLERLEAAAKLPDDEATIAADDQGASALAQKVEKLDRDAPPTSR